MQFAFKNNDFTMCTIENPGGAGGGEGHEESWILMVHTTPPSLQLHLMTPKRKGRSELIKMVEVSR